MAPAGSFESLAAALQGGADSVYFGVGKLNMRSRATANFSEEDLPEIVARCHEAGAKAYLTLNIIVYDEELEAVQALCDAARKAGVDAVIASDLAVIAYARSIGLEIHMSVQANVCNMASVRFYAQYADVVVLARELSLEEIRVIRQKVDPRLEIETFGHGAMCVSYSGRCLLSNYMTGRDSNRGECAQPCRYQYALMEEKRPGEYFPVYEDEKGTYILNSKDMCMIDHLGELMDAGVDCIKLEGRAKSAYYAAIVTGAYRHCIDAAAAGTAPDPVWRDEVDHISHRVYSTGFYYGQPGQYTETSRYIRQWQIVAMVEACDENGLARCSLRNKFSQGDALECVGPDCKPFPFPAGAMTDLEGAPLDEPRTPQMGFFMQLPQPVPPYSILRRAVDLSAK